MKNSKQSLIWITVLLISFSTYSQTKELDSMKLELDLITNTIERMKDDIRIMDDGKPRFDKIDSVIDLTDTYRSKMDTYRYMKEEEERNPTKPKKKKN